jgi:hypothetical protein
VAYCARSFVQHVRAEHRDELHGGRVLPVGEVGGALGRENAPPTLALMLLSKNM